MSESIKNTLSEINEKLGVIIGENFNGMGRGSCGMGHRFGGGRGRGMRGGFGRGRGLGRMVSEISNGEE